MNLFIPPKLLAKSGVLQKNVANDITNVANDKNEKILF